MFIVGFFEKKIKIERNKWINVSWDLEKCNLYFSLIVEVKWEDEVCL